MKDFKDSSSKDLLPVIQNHSSQNDNFSSGINTVMHKLPQHTENEVSPNVDAEDNFNENPPPAIKIEEVKLDDKNDL